MTVDTPEFRHLMAMYATACHDAYAKLEPRAVEQIQAAMVQHIDQHCARQAKLAEQGHIDEALWTFEHVPEGIEAINFIQQLLDGKATP